MSKTLTRPWDVLLACAMAVRLKLSFKSKLARRVDSRAKSLLSILEMALFSWMYFLSNMSDCVSTRLRLAPIFALWVARFWSRVVK